MVTVANKMMKNCFLKCKIGGGLPFRLFFVIMEMYILSKPKCFIVA